MSEGTGRRVREIRHSQGMSRQALAERAGFSLSYVAMVERGERADQRTVEAFAQALCVSPVELTGRPSS